MLTHKQILWQTLLKIVIASVIWVSLLSYSAPRRVQAQSSESPPFDPTRLVFETIAGDYGNIYNVIQNQDGFLWLAGINVEATDGQQATHLARALRPDLILMDRWMPVLDGFEATRRMQQMPELQETPIIAFLPKPVSWPNLAALLEEHLKLEWEYERKGHQERQEYEKEPCWCRHPTTLIPSMQVYL